MDRAYASGAASSAPAAPTSPSIGYPTKGNSGAGTPATKPGEYWYHMITEELRAVIVAAGIVPDHTDLDQLATAIASLAVVADATETVKGKVELATAEESQGLSSNNVVLTPERLASAFSGSNKSLGTSGYQKLPSGLIIQWGVSSSIPASGSLAIAFPVAFPNACSAVFLQGRAPSYYQYPTSILLSGFTANNSAGQANTVYWFAIGY